MRIGIDAMGGDFAPKQAVLGAVNAANNANCKCTIVLFGDAQQIDAILDTQEYPGNKIEVVHTTEVIGMGEHPAKSFQYKKDSSITIGFKHLYSGKIDAFTSAGNTGAMMVGTMYTIKSIPGIMRPCITSPIPKISGASHGVLLDVGLNSDCKPDVLYQYGILGDLFAKYYHEIEIPKVCLLNIGEEEEKGNLLTKATFELMKDGIHFDFHGNIESNELYTDKADVIVCDGFTGNIVLKQLESVYKITQHLQFSHPYLDLFNYENHGGTPVLGVNAPIVIGHGASNKIAFTNMILQTYHITNSDLTNKIKQAFQ
ncbi:MAG: phosphate acyltransferase PlsX [Bacteroidales bacterium]